MDKGEITKLLIDLREGKAGTGEDLARAVYKELHRLARHHLRREQPGHSLQPSDLVHKAFLRLIDQHERNWRNRMHFFGVAAHLMRLILLDHARRNRAIKHGGGGRKLALDKVVLFSEEQFDDLIALDEALQNLEKTYPRAARVVELRFFAELTSDEIGGVLGISEETVKRDWKAARLWLYRELTQPPGPPRQ